MSANFDLRIETKSRRQNNRRPGKATGFLVLFTLIFFQIQLKAQYSETDFERIKTSDLENKISGIDLAPDGKTLVLSQTRSKPVIIMDRETRQVTRKFNAGQWWSGASVTYSPQGKYLLLGQLMFIDFSKNKTRELPFDVIDASTGQQILSVEKCQDLIITRDEKYAVALAGTEVGFYALPSGKKEKSFVVEGLTSAVAESPDGKMIAVSRKVALDDLSEQAHSRKNKKSRKFTLKYKEVISLFDAKTFKPVFTVSEFYDKVYRLKFSTDGKYLFCLQIPPAKARTVSDPMVYVNFVEMPSGQPLRKAFTGQAVYEPGFELSHNGKMAALATKGSKFQEINLYDLESGQMLKRFELSHRLFEKDEEGLKVNDGSSPSMVFLPEDDSLLISLSNHLILWDLNLNK